MDVYESKLKQHRVLSGYTQGQLAYLAKVSVRSIQAYETGARDINKASVATVKRLADVLKCDIEELL